jgi:hypothetical protein
VRLDAASVDDATVRASSDERHVAATRPIAHLAARGLLWALVAAGGLGGCIGMLRPAAETAAPTPAEGAGGLPAGVLGFGEEAVAAWLEATGDGDDAAEVLFADPPVPASGTVTSSVRRTAAIGARSVDDDYWAVTVAAVVDERDRDQLVATTTLTIEVAVLADLDGRMTAVGTPAIVPGPMSPARGVDLAGPTPGVPAIDDPVLVSVQGFLDALLTGTGDVGPYLAPGVTVLPVDPPPFTEVTVDRLAMSDVDDGTVRARVVATAASPAGARRSLGYEIGLRQRAGRWEVTSLSGAPALDQSDITAATEPPATTASPTSSSTTTSFADEPGA